MGMVERLLELIVVLIIIVFNGSHCSEEEVESLYTTSDHILVLDNDNFNTTVYNQKRAFFVQFYSSWCGACINYTPLFKKLALELKPWSSVVQIAAVNCANEKNLKLCRDHQVDAYPTLRYFKYMSTKDEMVNFNGDKTDVNEVTKMIAFYVYGDWRQQRPIEWPNFDSVPNGIMVNDLWQQLPSDVALLVVVIENQPAVTAWAEMIAFAHEKWVHVVSVDTSHPSSRALGVEILQSPKVFVLGRNSSSPLYSSSGGETLYAVQEKITALLSNVDQSSGPHHRQGESSENTQVDWSQFEVQLQDLVVSLHYMLKAEIPRKQVIDGEYLRGLKIWVNAMKMYAPGTVPMRRFLYRLNEWIQSTKDGISADQWLEQVDLMLDQLGNPLPSNSSYMACRGSKPHLRGYSCGIWTLIHAMSVEAYKRERNNQLFNAANDLIEPFHQFIWHFFSCRECGKHFHDGILRQNMSVVVTPKDGVLWLWRTHNIVNKFIAKTETDDPAFPKQQFPPTSLCSNCRSSSDEFDENATFEFLLAYYGNIRTDSPKGALDYKISNFDDGRQIGIERKQMNSKFQVGAFDVDRLEKSEQRLIKDQLDSSPQRRWRELNTNDYDGRLESSAAYRPSYVLWLTIVAMVVLLIYMNYRRNRFKIWKTFYYYNGYKL